MLSEEKRNAIHDYIDQTVDGGASMGYSQIFDNLIEDEIISAEEFDSNELEICYIFDSGWFTCNECEWTVPNDCESYKEEGTCTDCNPDYD